jgi:hypothetical protein
MKWYWAIALTISILAIFAFVDDIPERLVITIIAVFAIWVAADSSSFGWGIFVFLLWPIACPWYLIVRPKVLPSEEPVRPKVLPSEEQATGDKLAQAFRLDQRGDWSEAIALYEQVAEESQGQQHAEYARNCAQQIREKMTSGD